MGGGGRGERGERRGFSTDFEEFSKEVKKACCHLMSSARLPVSNSTSLPDRLQIVRVETHTIAQCVSLLHLYHNITILIHTHGKYFRFSNVHIHFHCSFVYNVVSCTMYIHVHVQYIYTVVSCKMYMYIQYICTQDY